MRDAKKAKNEPKLTQNKLFINGLIKGTALLLCLVLFVPFFVACGFADTVNKASKNLSSYSITANLDDTTKTIKATAEVTYVNSSKDTLSSICFHLYGRAFREEALVTPYTLTNAAKCFPNGHNYGDLQVETVKVSGVFVPINLIGEDMDILSVELSSPLAFKKKVTLEIAYTLTLSENTHRLGFFENTINLGNWYPVACVYENGAYVMDPYHSTGDPFYSEASNFSVTMTYPSGYKIFHTGEKKSETKENDRTTIIMKAEAVRDFAMVLGASYKEKSKKTGETTITYVGYEGDSDIDQNLETSVSAFKTFSRLFGEYPYTTLVVAKTKFMFGGMEYPNLVWIADNIKDPTDKAKVIAHEIAHQWWYGVVGNNEVSEPWLDEALAEYLTVLFFEENKGYNYSGNEMVQDASTSLELYTEIINSIGGSIQTKMTLATNEYATEYEYIYMVYVKGTLFYDALRDKIGKKNFLKALKSYYKDNKFKNVTAKNLQKAFEKAAGYELEDFFESWNTK